MERMVGAQNCLVKIVGIIHIYGGCIGRELETRAVKSKLRNSKAHKFKGCPRYSYFFHQMIALKYYILS